LQDGRAGIVRHLLLAAFLPATGETESQEAGQRHGLRG
jgi:hypothetical protein